MVVCSGVFSRFFPIFAGFVSVFPILSSCFFLTDLSFVSDQLLSIRRVKNSLGVLVVIKSLSSL